MDYIILLKLLTVVFCLSHLAGSIAEMLPEKKWTSIFRYVLGCKSCFSFWFTLILSGDLFIASLMWTVMFFYSKFIEPKIDKTIL